MIYLQIYYIFTWFIVGPIPRSFSFNVISDTNTSTSTVNTQTVGVNLTTQVAPLDYKHYMLTNVGATGLGHCICTARKENV